MDVLSLFLDQGSLGVFHVQLINECLERTGVSFKMQVSNLLLTKKFGNALVYDLFLFGLLNNSLKLLLLLNCNR